VAAVVRPAQRADAAAADRILRRARRDSYSGVLDETELGLGDEGLRRFDRALARDRDGTGCCVVAEVDGRVCGFAEAGPSNDPGEDRVPVGQVYAIYVDPDDWRAGVGRALMDAVDRWFRAGAFTEATLWVREENTRARAFYAALGWRLDGASKPSLIAGKVPVTEVRYRRPLREANRGQAPSHTT
jgi:ribosomal protein S18 acetylase RimI-like enzyme